MPRKAKTVKTEKQRNKTKETLSDDESIFADVFDSKKVATRKTAKRNYDLADLSSLKENEPAKKQKLTRKKVVKEESVDIGEMLMATEGDHLMSPNKENIKPKATRKKKKAESDEKVEDKPQSRKKAVAKSKSTKKAPAKKEPVAKKSRGKQAKEEVKEEVKEEESDWESEEETKRTRTRKATKKPAKEVAKKGKGKQAKEKESDWSDSSDEETAKKSKVKATTQKDGSIEITIGKTAAQKKTAEEDWIAKAIKSAINKDATNQARMQHKINLLCLSWYGMKWDSAVDDPVVTAKILSKLPLKVTKPTNTAQMKSFLKSFNSSFEHLEEHNAKKGIPSPKCALIVLDQLIEGPGGPLYDRILDQYSNFGNFLRTLLLLGAARGVGLVARLAMSFDVINHKPQSANQKAKAKKMNSDRPNKSCVWVEVYCGKAWEPIVLDEGEFQIWPVKEVEKKMKWPMTYAVAFDGGMRDVTARYASEWLTETKKLRIKYIEKKEENWWKDTCALFPSRNNHLEAEENRNLSKKVLSQEIPQSLAKLKGHPIYVAERHLLKYETLWPRDVEPVGQVKVKDGFENIYLRKHVKPLHTRGTWLQKARVVRDAEEPAKMVASWMQNKKRKVDKDFKGSALFGEWQVDHYQPPIARDGKVPRNAFGNVDLYQECMLPIGTVWIREIEHGTFSRVCRKLGIDTAKAVIGFDGKKGYPVTEGYILCTENEKTVMEAYYEQCGYDQEKRERERKIRIRKLWHRAYRGVLIKKKVERMFNGETVDPNIERIMLGRMYQEGNHPANQTETQSKKSGTNSSGAKSGSSKKSKDFSDSEKSASESEPESESDMTDESDAEEEQRLAEVKPTKAIQRRKTMPRRQAAMNTKKIELSSDSSDFENSEDEFRL